MVIAGSWSDRFGPRAPLLATVVAFALGLTAAFAVLGGLVSGRTR